MAAPTRGPGEAVAEGVSHVLSSGQTSAPARGAVRRRMVQTRMIPDSRAAAGTAARAASTAARATGSAA